MFGCNAYLQYVFLQLFFTVKSSLGLFRLRLLETQVGIDTIMISVLILRLVSRLSGLES